MIITATTAIGLTTPTTQGLGDVAAIGSAVDVARSDHSHGLIFNLVNNGSFEIGNPPTNWALSGAGATITQDNTHVKIDANAAKLIRNGTDANIYQYSSVVIPSVPYTFGCWVWASVASRVRLGLFDGTTLTYSSYHTGDSTWQWITVGFTVGAGANQITPRCQIDTGNTTAWFDGACLVRLPVCPEYNDYYVKCGLNSPSTQAFGDSVNYGVAVDSARSDHKHAMPANPVSNFSYVSGSNFTTTSATLVDITGLTAALDANKKYEFKARLSVRGGVVSVAMGVNYSVGGATILGQIAGQSSALYTFDGEEIYAFNTATSAAYCTNYQAAMIIEGIVVVGANAGNLTIQIQIAGGNTATVYINSYLRVGQG